MPTWHRILAMEVSGGRTLAYRLNVQTLIGIQGYSFLRFNKRTGPNKRTYRDDFFHDIYNLLKK